MDDSSIRECCKSSNYAFTGKLMLISVVVVVFVCVFLGFFQVFRRRRNLGFLEASGAAVGDNGAQRLDPSVPTFVHSSAEGRDGRPLECSVCLSELRDNETGRVLTECDHCFHADCIDMWFPSQTNCPLCRAQIMPVKDPV